MSAHLKLKPEQKGSKKLIKLYGSRFVCIRYRYDERHQKRLYWMFAFDTGCFRPFT